MQKRHSLVRTKGQLPTSENQSDGVGESHGFASWMDREKSKRFYLFKKLVDPIYYQSGESVNLIDPVEEEKDDTEQADPSLISDPSAGGYSEVEIVVQDEDPADP